MLANMLYIEEPNVADLLLKLLGEGNIEAIFNKIICNFGKDNNSL